MLVHLEMGKEIFSAMKTYRPHVRKITLETPTRFGPVRTVPSFIMLIFCTPSSPSMACVCRSSFLPFGSGWRFLGISFIYIFRAGNTGPTAHKLGGKDLPHGVLSSYVENKVKARLKEAYEAEAKEQGVDVDKVQ